MKSETGCVKEAFVAMLTLEGFVGEMRLHMHHQRVGLCEALVALVALQ